MERSSQMVGTIFPDHSMQTLSSFIHLTGSSILAFCFARRTKHLFSWDMWVEMPWRRLTVLLVLADSWLFLFSTGILISGAGMSSSFANCALGVYACILLYGFSKVMIYCFLIEKVHIVWGGTHQPRLQSKVYWLCLITMAPYAAIIIIMLVARIAFFRPDQTCIIGLRRYASLSLLVYDLYLNVFLTGMFLWPLFRSRLSNPRIRRMAMRTLVAAVAALTTSTVNIAILTMMGGQQLGWVCLGSCGLDVTINALVLFWVTGNINQPVEKAPGRGGIEDAASPNGATPGTTAAPNPCLGDEETTKRPKRSSLPPYTAGHSPYVGTMYDYMAHGPNRASCSAQPRTSTNLDNIVFSKEKRGGQRSNSRELKGGHIFGRIGEVLRRKSDDDDRCSPRVSVQVTVITEQQEDHATTGDANPAPSSSSPIISVGGNAQDIENGATSGDTMVECSSAQD